MKTTTCILRPWLLLVFFLLPGMGWARSKPKQLPKPQPVEEEVESIDVAQASISIPEDLFSQEYPQFDRALDLPTGRVSRPGTFNTLIVHRNSEGAFKNPGRDFLGFDGGALKIGLGLRYGITDIWDVGILRVNGTVEVYDTYELDTRLQVLKQGKHPIDASLRLGLSVFSQPLNNASGVLLQFLFSRLIENRVMLGSGFLYHSNSSGFNKSNSDTPSSAAWMILVDARLLAGWSWAFELTTNIAGYHAPYPIITTGPRIITNRHTFAVVISNSQSFTADSIVTNTSINKFTDWVLGFNITREI